MAVSRNNIITQGLSGKVDNLVFRQRNGMTIVGKMPRPSATESVEQKTTRVNFRQASVYAKVAAANAATRPAYLAKVKPGQTAYNVAMADFLKPPEIGEIDVSGYTGRPGSTIKVAATDDFKVAGVRVKIENRDGFVAEEGEATMEKDGLHWVYHATKFIGSLAETNIRVTAADLPGNLSTKQKGM